MRYFPAALLIAWALSACAQVPDDVRSANWENQAVMMDTAVPR